MVDFVSGFFSIALILSPLEVLVFPSVVSSVNTMGRGSPYQSTRQEVYLPKMQITLN